MLSSTRELRPVRQKNAEDCSQHQSENRLEFEVWALFSRGASMMFSMSREGNLVVWRRVKIEEVEEVAHGITP